MLIWFSDIPKIWWRCRWATTLLGISVDKQGYSALSESYSSELLSRARWGCPQVRFNLDPGPSSSASKATGGETIWGQACCGFMRPFPASGSNVSWDILSAYMLGVPGRTCLDGFQSFLYTHCYFFTMFDFRCSTGCPTQFDLNFHVIPWISMNSLRDLHHFTSTKHHFSPNPPQPIQDCGRSVGHVSELRKVQLSQAMRRAREQLSERLEMSKMTASQLETWRWLRDGELDGYGCGWG